MKTLLPVAVVAAVAGWFGGPLVHSTTAARAPRDARSFPTGIGPVALSSEQLRAKAMALATPIYWAGPVFSDRYEFTRLRSDQVYVRYLPWGVRSGAPGARFLIVATYPWPEAYKALRRIARGRGVVGPGGRFILARPYDPKSVLVAFPRVPYEIEIYDPNPALAERVAESGNLSPVR